MKYMGSKNRHAKYILPIMLKHRTEDQYWVEPFVGGGNIIDKVDGFRLGADNNPYVIEALLAIKNHLNELPKDATEFTEADYAILKFNDAYRFKGYAGFAFSYGGKWLGGWGRDSEGKRDYVREAYNNACKQSKNLEGVDFVVSDYRNLVIPPNSLIYCDPPYKNTTKYNSEFDHEVFWAWCMNKKLEGHTVFVSEYSAPKQGVQCVWTKTVHNSLTQDTGSKKGTEKLFYVL